MKKLYIIVVLFIQAGLLFSSGIFGGGGGGGDDMTVDDVDGLLLFSEVDIVGNPDIHFFIDSSDQDAVYIDRENNVLYSSKAPSELRFKIFYEYSVTTYSSGEYGRIYFKPESGDTTLLTNNERYNSYVSANFSIKDVSSGENITIEIGDYRQRGPSSWGYMFIREFTFSIIQDNAPPTINISQNTTEWTNDEVTFSAVAFDDLIGLGFQDRYLIVPGSGLKDIGGNITTWDGDIRQLGITGYIYPYNESQRSFTVNSYDEKIQFFAYDRVNNETKTEILQAANIDQTPPIVTVSSTNIDWINENQTITAVVNDQDVSNDGVSGIDLNDQGRNRYRTYNFSTGAYGSWGSWSSGVSRTLSTNGQYQIQFEGHDRAGNTATGYSVIQIDKVPPTNSNTSYFNPDVYSSTSPYYTSSTLNLVNEFSLQDQSNLSGLDESSIEYSIGSAGTWQDYTGPIDMASLGTNMLQIAIRYSDNAGNTVETGWYYANIDTEDPTIVVPSEVWTDGQNINITVADGSGSGINESSLQWRKSGTSVWQNFPITGLSEGENAVDLRVSDNAGNTATRLNVAILVDTMPPTVSASIDTAGVESGVFSNLESVSISADSDPGVGSGTARMAYILTDEPNDLIEENEKSYDEGNLIPITAEGRNLIQFVAYDVAGNRGVSETLEICLDRKDPVINYSLSPSISQADWTSEDVTIAFLNTDVSEEIETSGINTTEYSIDNGTSWTDDFYNLFSSHGKHSLMIRVSDKAGNSSQRTIAIWIDKHGPVVSGSVDTYVDVSTGMLSLNTFTAVDMDAGMGDVPYHWQYSIDNFDDDGFIDFNPATGMADMSAFIAENIEEGEHTIIVRTFDELGNPGVWTPDDGSNRIVFDYTPPQIDSVEITDGSDSLIGLHEYSMTSTFDINVAMNDTFMNGGVSQAGEIAGFYYYVSNEALALQPEHSEGNYVEGSGTNAGGLAIGDNYLYVWPVDSAGNVGEVYERVILFDNGTPNVPDITSSTHRKANAIIDAVPFKDARFEISPSGSSISGIRSFEYSLLKGTEAIKEGKIDGDGSEAIEFLNLKDNDEEYYELHVAAIGGNGLPGNTAVYRFRIDTSPPENLTIYAQPHINSDRWYSSARTSFSWQRPVDMTGVRSYYYFLSSTEITLPQSDEEAAGFDITTWQQYSRNQMNINLADTLQIPTGTAFMYLCAEDYAGNREFASYLINFDTIAPWLEPMTYSGDDYLTVTVNSPNRSAVIAHGTPGDDREAVSVEARLFSVSEQGLPMPVSEYQSTEDRQSEFIGLDPDGTYLAEMRVSDASGNTTSYTSAFRVDGEPVSIVIALPFTKVIDGYTVSGMMVPSGSGSEASLLPAEQLHMAEVVDGNTVEGPFSFDSITFDNGSFSSGSFSPDRVFTLDIHGFSFTGTGVSFNEDSGLTFDVVEYRGSVYNSITEEVIPVATSMTGFTVGFEPVFDLSTVPYTSHAVNELSVRTKTSTDSVGFILDSPVSSGFANTEYELKESEWNTFPIYESFNVDIFTETNDGGNGTIEQQTLSVLSAEIDGNGILSYGEIKTPFFVRSKGSLLQINSGWLEDDRLYITDAVLILPEGFSPQLPIVRNFYISLSGEYEQLPDFYSEGFVYSDSQGNQFEFDSISLIDGAFFGEQGSVTTAAGSEFFLAGIQIGETGPIYDTPVQVTQQISLSLSGYSVVSDDAVITADGLLLRTADILNLPTQFGGGNRTVHNLGIILADESVYKTGFSTQAFEMRPPGYENTVLVNRLELRDNGLFATEADISLPTGITNSGTSIVPCVDLELLSDGTFGLGTLGNGLPLTIHGFETEAFGASFNGTVLRFDHVDVTLPYGLIPPVATLTDMTVGGEGIRTPGVTEEIFRFRTDGWNYFLNGLSFTDAGLESDSSLKLARRLGGREIKFPDFILNSNGSYSTGSADVSSIVRIGGWKTRLAEISISGETMTAASGTVRTFASMGGTELVFPNIVLHSRTGFESSGTGTAVRSFMAENGFSTEAESYTLTNEGIEFTGNVYFPRALGENSHAVYTQSNPAMLYYNGVIATNISEQEVTYKVAGWDVRGTDLYFNEAGLFIQKSEIDIPNTSISFVFPEMAFYADGSVKAAGHSFENISMPFFGGRFDVDKIAFDDKGLTAAAFIELPPALESYRLYFDKLTFLPDGSVTTDASIPEFGFKLQKADLDFRFRNIRFDQGNLTIGEGLLTLPEAMEDRQVRITNFTIDSNGNFDLGGIGFDPFEMWGYTFYLDNIGISNSDISFDGSIVLPDGLPSGLAGKRLAISDFQYGIETNEVESFDVSLEGEFPFSFTNDIELVINTFGIRKIEQNYLLYVDEGRLSFPDTLGLDEVSIFDLSINPVTYAFDFDNVTISGFQYSVFGLDFLLDSISFSSDFDIILAGSVAFPSTDEIPELLRGESITVNTFEILHDATIGDVDGAIDLNGNLFDILTLSSGHLEFAKVGSELTLGLEGDLALTGSSFPDGLRNKIVNINEFKINTSNWDVVEFDAGVSNLEFNLFNLVTFRNTSIAASETEDGKFQFDMEGDIYLPDALPEYIRRDPVHISEFTIDSTGSISAFHASKDFSGDNDIYGFITARNTHFEAEYDHIGDRVVFNIDGTTIILGDRLPEGIRGATAVVETFSFDSIGHIEDVSVSTTIPDGNLFGTLPISGAGVSFSKQGDTDLLIEVTGSLGMPSGTPAGLEEVVIDINRLAFTSSGYVEDVDIGASGISANIMGVLTLEEGSVEVAKDGNSALLFTLTGDLSLPRTMPAPFGTMTFSLNPIAVSTTRGLVDFQAGLAGSINFNLFAGITGTCNSIDISREGIALSGSLSAPQGMPILDGRTVILETFAMDWDGEITEIAAGFDSLTSTLAGFTIDVNDLIIHKDHVTIAQAELTMPSVLQNQRFGLRNAQITYDGQFEGEFITPDIKFDIVGFKLILENPSLDVNNELIRFTQTRLETPDIIGGSTLTVNNMTVGPGGLNFGGAGFDLPSFTLASGLEFALHANFALDGSSYFVDAGGKIVIPAMGGFEVEASFTNKSSTYPWGLKRAFFEWQAANLGIPLGTTNLYMNAIRGGLAFGPPDEIPSVVRPYFKNGTRIQAGFSIRNGGAPVLTGNVDSWIDITNWYFAVDGDIAVFNGFLSAEATAAITGNMFYSRVAFELVYVKGETELWIWKDGQKMKVAGQGSVRFGLRRGSIYSKKIGWVRIRIPSSSIWLGSIGAKFGDFTNNKSGFIGYAKFRFVGTIGLFASSSGSFKLGKLSGYNLRIPGGASYSINSAQFSVASSGGLDTSTKSMNIAGDFGSTSVISGPEFEPVLYLDSTAPVVSGDNTFLFTVPGTNVPAVFSKENYSMDSNGQAALETNLNISETRQVDPVERIIFIIGYEDGAPSITATSPSGGVYSAELGNAEEFQVENGSVIVVMDPEPGEWTVDIDGLANNQPYTIDVMGKTRIPELSGLTPAYQGESAGNGYTVSGNAAWYSGTDANLFVNLLTEEGDTLGIGVGDAVLSQSGEFTVDLLTNHVPDGTYRVQFELDDGDSMPMVMEAPGTLTVVNTQPLPPVNGLVVSRNDESSIKVSFDALETPRAAGYELYVQDSEGTVKRDIRSLASLVIPGIEDGGDYSVWVVAYDTKGIRGAQSAVVNYIHAVESRVLNTPVLSGSEGADLPETVNLEIGEFTDLSIECRAGDFTQTGEALDYASFEVLEGPQWLSVIPDANQYELSGTAGTLSLNTFDFDTDDGEVLSASPGSYNVTIGLRNLGNKDLIDEYSFTLEVGHPAPQIGEVLPDSWHSYDSQDIVVIGSNFTPGTSFYINDEELEVTKLLAHEASFTIPAGLPGGANSVRAVGPDGTEASFSVDIVVPGYTVEVYKQIGREPSGNTDRLFFGIKGYERFEGTAEFTLTSLPEGWNGTVSSAVLEGTAGVLEITAPEGTPPGEYPVEVTCDAGYIINFIMNVTEERTGPEARLVYPSAVIAGKDIWIYGNYFGENTSGEGQVLLNGEPMNILDWEDDRICVATGIDDQTGTLVVIREDGTASEELDLFVKDSGFVIFPDTHSLRLQPGDEADIMLALKGAALPVTLEAAAVDYYGEPVFSTSIEDTEVTPNNVTHMQLSIPQDAENGTYSLIVSGTSESFENQIEIPVVIGEAFTIDTASLPSGMVDSAYYSKLAMSNAVGTVAFSVAEGQLPLGLTLSRDGVITGKPGEYGETAVTIEAIDEAEHIARREYTVSVTENVWAMNGKDEGASRYIPAAGPAFGTRSWDASWTEAADARNSLISGGGRVYAFGGSGIRAYEQNNGYLIWRNSEPVEDARYLNGKLYILDQDGMFGCYDAQYGHLLWSREDVEAMVINGGLLYLWESSSTGTDLVQVLISDSEDVPQGYVHSIKASVERPAGAVTVFEGNLYDMRGTELYRLDETADSAVWSPALTAAGAIESVSALIDTLIVLSNTGTLSRYSRSTENGTLIKIDEVSSGIGSADGTTVLGENLYGAYGFDGAVLYETSTGNEVLRRGTPVKAGLLSREKLYLATDAELMSVNLYSGRTIWREYTGLGSYESAIVSNGRLFSLEQNTMGTEKRLTAYSGAPNRDAPAVDIILDPSVPDGANGFYISEGTVSMTASDSETYVSEMNWRIDEPLFHSYQGSVKIEEGNHSIVAYAVDSDGKRSRDMVMSYIADLNDPITDLSIETQMVKGTDRLWYPEPPVFSLTATDGFSGVEYIEYRLNNGEWTQYSTPVTVDKEGINLLEYRATDHAGRIEETHSVELAVDLSKPLIEQRITAEPGLGIVHLDAEDAGSGVKEIAYAIDTVTPDGITEGVYTTYDTPVVVTDPGTYRIRFKAYDNTDRVSDEGTDIFEVEAYSEDNLFIDLEYGKRLPGRRIIEGVEPGDRIFSTGYGRHNRFDSVPPEVVNGFYLQPHSNEINHTGEPLEFAHFRAGVNLDVYMMADPDTAQDLTGWMMTETAHPIEEDHYYKDGADVYRRSYLKGEEVILYTAEGWRVNPSLYVIVPTNAAGILITEPVGILAPGQGIRISGTILSGDPSQTTVEITTGAGSTETLSGYQTSDGVAADYLLPPAAEMDGDSMKLVITVSNAVASKSKEMLVVNQEGIYLDNPAPGSQVEAGSLVEVEYRLLKPDGAEETAAEALEGIVWETTRDPDAAVPEGESSWQAVELVNGSIEAPFETGPWYIRGSYNSRRAAVRLNVVEVPGEEQILFGTESEHGASMGEILEKEDGSYNATEGGIVQGFSNDLTGNIVSFNTIQLYWPFGFTGHYRSWKPVPHTDIYKLMQDRGPYSKLGKDDRGYLSQCWGAPEKPVNPAQEEKTAIVLEDETSYHVRVNNGRYKVVLETGPSRGIFGRPKVTVNGSTYSVRPVYFHHTQMQLTVEVEVSDGWLTISGEDRPVLARLSWEPLAGTDPTVPVSLTHIPGLIITRIHWPPGLDPVHDRRDYGRFRWGGEF